MSLCRLAEGKKSVKEIAVDLGFEHVLRDNDRSDKASDKALDKGRGERGTTPPF